MTCFTSPDFDIPIFPGSYYILSSSHWEAPYEY
jgi:hypothetical protein